MINLNNNKLKGTIMFTSYDNIDNLDISKYDIKLQIVRFSKKGLKAGFKHIPSLAPSNKLFQRAMYRWQKLKYTKKELEYMKTGKTRTWFDLYERDFYQEKKADREFKIAYDRLKYYLDNGINIIAICYCTDFRKCHRSLIAMMLKNEGYCVILE